MKKVSDNIDISDRWIKRQLTINSVNSVIHSCNILSVKWVGKYVRLFLNVTFITYALRYSYAFTDSSMIK